MYHSKRKNWREQDGRGVGDVEYISLHGYIRNTASDTEVHAERQLREDRSIWPVENNIWNQEKLSRMKELVGGGAEPGVLVGLDLPSASRGTEAGVQSSR